jgi:hypothetical protein
VKEHLDAYAVGTAKMKRSRGRPNPKDLGLIRTKKFVKPETIVNSILKQEKKEASKEATDWDEVKAEQGKDVHYNEIDDAIAALSECMKGHKELVDSKKEQNKRKPVGFELVKLRKDPLKETDYEHVISLKDILEKRMFDCEEVRSRKKIKLDHPVETSEEGRTDNDKNDDDDAMPKKAPAKKRIRKKCCIKHCNNRINLTRVPHTTKKPKENWSKDRLTTYAVDVFLRRELCDRLGLGRDCKRSDLRYCLHHPTEIKTFHGIKIKDHLGKKVIGSTSRAFDIVLPIGAKSSMAPPSTLSKGIGSDRQKNQTLLSVPPDSFELALQTTTELADGDGDLSTYNDYTLQLSGLAAHKELSSASKRQTKLPARPAKSGPTESSSKRKVPVITIHDMIPKEVHRRTGFCNLEQMLSYVMVLCDGDLNKVFSTTSTLTWLEEWVFYFELTYGRTRVRWEDYQADWILHEDHLRALLKSKLILELETRKRWPAYASVSEDAKLRKESWEGLFEEAKQFRIYMHDNTDVPLMKPSNPDEQRAFYSDYYGQCCAKGGVACQLCGYIRTFPLCTGGIGDQDYVEKTKIFEKQSTFTKQDKSAPNSPALNIFDRGYRVILAALANGQQILQPDFAPCDGKFNANETLHSAAVAVVRSGNERAVNVVKRSWYIKRGGMFSPNIDLEKLDDVWLAFGFRVNFMYSPVH